ncbi:unnamed protein product [Didymodactylos carnosus]|uniref:PBZ-type domain-containing protein n=1 Tax=Didymodactylos carnosus TaxID=1234261 RepID=A0A814LF89_9BILA|nr:unnamed protein product [Didymodactylos carnosus]CAF1319340.1 unnamed protein product [Didymodactylos carnosus]CAF3831530.1 unnamed protein product [Didymodactylos carnosus]CAF4129129.1 unnamed protein product [Didymodactylos carnosus]
MSDKGASPEKKKKTDTSSLPQCPYGAKCYRKNPLHFREYLHSAVAPEPSSTTTVSTTTASTTAASTTAAGTTAAGTTAASTTTASKSKIGKRSLNSLLQIVDFLSSCVTTSKTSYDQQ